MRNLLNKWHVQNPERIIYQMVDDYIKHRLDDNRVLFRASVVEIDTVGGAFESNPQNPKNSIRARNFYAHKVCSEKRRRGSGSYFDV